MWLWSLHGPIVWVYGVFWTTADMKAQTQKSVVVVDFGPSERRFLSQTARALTTKFPPESCTQYKAMPLSLRTVQSTSRGEGRKRRVQFTGITAHPAHPAQLNRTRRSLQGPFPSRWKPAATLPQLNSTLPLTHSLARCLPRSLTSDYSQNRSRPHYTRNPPSWCGV